MIQNVQNFECFDKKMDFVKTIFDKALDVILLDISVAETIV